MLNQDEQQLEEIRVRALHITANIRARDDLGVRKLIKEFEGNLEFANRLEELGIAPEAWQYIIETQIDPKLVFAHPTLLRAIPEASLHYRGISMISLKGMGKMRGSGVQKWENGTWKVRPAHARCLQIARIYNMVISVLITGTDKWSLENGYRNILVTIGITQDGMFRNMVGNWAEEKVKERIGEWLLDHDTIQTVVHSGTRTDLTGNGKTLRMVYSSEPDIRFEEQNDQGRWEFVCTIEVKGGTDTAGALERLGAIQKSFSNVPTRCQNFAILGVVTPTMRERLREEAKVTRDFLLYPILNDEQEWQNFVTEIFHHCLRLY